MANGVLRRYVWSELGGEGALTISYNNFIVRRDSRSVMRTGNKWVTTNKDEVTTNDE